MNFNQNIKFRQNEVDNLAGNIIEKKIVKETSDLQNFVKLYNLRKLFFYQTKLAPTPKKEEFKKIIQLAKELTISNNSKFYFVYFPEYGRYKKNEKYDNINYNLVKEVVSELNINFIDLHKEVFDKENNPLKFFPFELHGHYTVEGYQKVSEKIYSLTK